MSETVLKIEGMTCMHCKKRVEKALKGVLGVTSVQVDLANKQAVVSGSAEQAVMAKAVVEAGPSMQVDNMVLISGKVERTTEFEKGFPGHQSKRNGRWEPDPLIMDDQCAIINLRGKGLVILSGCGHSGIVNTIRHAQALTGVQSIYAVIGGFHLTGALFAPIIPPTVAALKKIKPRYLMPGHCTGWSAIHQIATAMPDAFIPNSVGTTLVL